MPINYEITSKSVGDENDPFQIFIANDIIRTPDQQEDVTIFEVPTYLMSGATFDFYSQDIYSVSTNLNNKKILTFNFTGNSTAFSAVTNVNYDVYRIPNTVFEKYRSVLESNAITSTTLTQEQITAVREFNDSLSTPLITFEESGSTVIASTHSYEFPDIIKPTGQFSQKLFNDKSQYFIDTTYDFTIPQDFTLGEYKMFSGGTLADISDDDVTSNLLITSSTNQHIITGGTFSGTTINGAFFTYFVAPNKPNLNVVNDAPTVSGILPTFSPTFAFNNVEDGDYYKLQVSYDIEDKTFSTDAAIFPITKQAGDAEYIRLFSIALNPNSEFIYRIGNTKEIKNIFDIKQSITVWSEFGQATTLSDGAVYLSGTTYQISESPANILTGVTISMELLRASSDVDVVIDNSNISDISSGATTPLDSTIGSIFTDISDSNGEYTINVIKKGTYKLTASHPSYGSKTYNIIITGDANADVIFALLMGNTVVTFADVANLLFL